MYTIMRHSIGTTGDPVYRSSVEDAGPINVQLEAVPPHQLTEARSVLGGNGSASAPVESREG